MIATLFIGYTIAMGFFIAYISRSARLAVPTLLLFITLQLVAYSELTGYSKDTNLTFLRDKEYEVIAYSTSPPDTIWVWVWDDEPRAFAIPYSEDTERKLHEGKRSGEENGTRTMFNPGKREVHPEPPSPLPNKSVPRSLSLGGR